MNVSFALFADAANLSQEGKLNILGVFDAVQVGTTPTVHPRAHLVVRLKGTYQDAGTHSLTLRWINPRGSELWSSTGEIEVTAPPPTVVEMDVPIIASIDLPLDQPGTFAMEIVLDNQSQARLDLQVRSAAPMAPATTMLS
jgi:hypothetical protein